MFSSQQTHNQNDADDRKNVLGFCSFCLELGTGTSKRQNWKGLCIAFMVISVICLFIGAAIFLVSLQRTIPHHEPPSITELDLIHTRLPIPWNGTWISDKYFFYLDINESIWIYNCDTLKEELLFRRDTVQQENIGRGIVSPSTKYILVPIRKEKIRPYYTEYQYDLYEKTKMIGPISLGDDRKIAISSIVYSHSDHLFAFIYNFDVYIYDINMKTSYRVTSDGNRSALHNGLVEWIYEYEIFKQTTLLFWSPNDDYLAFIKVNLTRVPRIHYLKYDLTLENDDQYSIPYSKYRDPLPLTEIYIHNLKSRKTFSVPRPAEFTKIRKSDAFVYHVVWCHEFCLSVVYGNRVQNSTITQLYEISNDKPILKSKVVEESKKPLLLTRHLKPYFSSHGTYAYTIRFDPLIIGKVAPKPYPRVVRIYLNQSYPQIDAKSPDDVNVDEIMHVTKSGQVYFTGSPNNNILEKQLYRWTYADSKSLIECLSCNESCGYVNAQFSLGNGSYYVLECFGPSIPFASLYNRNKKLARINYNEPFREWASNRLMPVIEYFTVPLDEKNTVGHGMIILPPTYNPNATIISYPLIVMMKERLAEQHVNKKYVLPFIDLIHVVQDNIGVVLFDPHGSSGQDESYLKSNFEDWFERQYEDYIKLAQHIKWNEKKFNGKFSNAKIGLKARGPMAVVALKLLEEGNRDNPEYSCAFLQSPVNDLSQYHALFSERINELKHGITSSHQLNIRNKSLAIVHGTADEVVHFTHSATLVKALINSGISFDFKVYPDSNHYLELDPLLYNYTLNYQRRFFNECFAERMNEKPKIVLTEDND